MTGHVKAIVRRKVSDFIRLEDGQVGNRSTFTAAALATASSLAFLLLTPSANAVDCGGQVCCGAIMYCCNKNVYQWKCVPHGDPAWTCWYAGPC